MILDTVENIAISILAPARGATEKKMESISSKANFNPRSREGSDKGKADGGNV